MAKKRKARAKTVPRHQRISVLVLTALVIAVGAIGLIARYVGNASAQTSTQKRPLTQQEAQQLASELKGLLNKDGVVAVKHPDGSSSLESPNGFQNVTVARVEEDGSVTRSCVDNPREAANFFGLDPALVGAKQQTPQASQPAKTRVKTTLQ